VRGVERVRVYTDCSIHWKYRKVLPIWMVLRLLLPLVLKLLLVQDVCARFLFNEKNSMMNKNENLIGIQ
jgi:hypothetical protein